MDHRLGCSRIPWMCTIQGHPSWRLQVDWICSGLAGEGWVPWVEGGRSLLHMIPHGPGWVEIHSAPASFARHIKHNCTVDRPMMITVHRLPLCRAHLLRAKIFFPWEIGPFGCEKILIFSWFQRWRIILETCTDKIYTKKTVLSKDLGFFGKTVFYNYSLWCIFFSDFPSELKSA
jgi:hypothetical protein